VPAAVVNASPLAFLARLGRLDALDVFQPLLTTDVVIQEIEEGLLHGHREILAVRDLTERGTLKVRRVAPSPIPGLTLDPGELTVVQVARGIKGAVAVVDDLSAIKAARHLGISVRSTPFVLLMNVEGGAISRDEFARLMDRLMKDGYFLAPSIYLKLLEGARTAGRP